MLRTIHRAPLTGPAAGDLARELGVTQPTIADAVASLERKGYVTRVPDPEDGRRSQLTLTSPGRRVVVHLDASDAELAAAVDLVPTGTHAHMLRGLLEAVDAFLEAGVLQVARTCTSCRFYSQEGDTASCALLGRALQPGALRANCGEHVPAGV